MHHIVHWCDGGPTSLDNAALLCEFHHRLVHSQGWTVRLGKDQHPEFIAPGWLTHKRKTRAAPWRRALRDLRRGFAPDNPPQDPPDDPTG